MNGGMNDRMKENKAFDGYDTMERHYEKRVKETLPEDGHVRKAIEFVMDMVKSDIGSESIYPTVVVNSYELVEENGNMVPGPYLTGVCVMAVPFNEFEEKKKAMEDLGAKFMRDQHIVRSVVLISEAWMSSQTRTQPRYDPNRKEVVIFAGKTIDNKQDAATVDLFRGEDGKITGFGEPRWVPDGVFAIVDHFWRGYVNAAPPNVKARLNANPGPN